MDYQNFDYRSVQGLDHSFQAYQSLSEFQDDFSLYRLHHSQPDEPIDLEDSQDTNIPAPSQMETTTQLSEEIMVQRGILALQLLLQISNKAIDPSIDDIDVSGLFTTYDDDVVDKSVGTCTMEEMSQGSLPLVAQPVDDDKCVGTFAMEAKPQESLLSEEPPLDSELEPLHNSEGVTSTYLELLGTSQQCKVFKRPIIGCSH
ncbi:uncharacterized protein LOC122000517 [Zingiber officinale]|uniref:uncharacterized protein LOC122000517 n=1 Tax=Zingiber officinale TaxID=94328 RepID=UPI001C4D93A7|nr:uncharacterized protein LOC122000517 [Zingiber officinale]